LLAQKYVGNELLIMAESESNTAAKPSNQNLTEITTYEKSLTDLAKFKNKSKFEMSRKKTVSQVHRQKQDPVQVTLDRYKKSIPKSKRL